MAMAGVYRRILPSPPAIDFASSEGKQLFVEAIQSGTMEGPWRWFDESMLDCCEPLEKVKAHGISLGKVVCLARCAGAKVEAFRTNQSTFDDFRKYVIKCTTSDDCHVISSYHRGIFRQTGTGHFSPIGGYHAGKDMALILDVARFKYPPHWVPLKLLWDAMDTVDESTGKHRGFMLVSKLQRAPALLYTLSCRHESWISTATYLIDDVPALLESDNLKDIKDVLSVLFTSLPTNFAEFIKWVAEVRRREDGGQTISQEEKGRLAIKEEILKQVQETGLYKHVTEILSSNSSCFRNTSAHAHKDKLPEIAASVCCQGAQLLAGTSGSSAQFCCRETCMEYIKANGDKPIAVVSSTVVDGTNEQGVDVLVPLSQMPSSCCDCNADNYIGMYPASSDVLTALLLALPPETWSRIKNETLLHDIHNLVSTENFPTLLQEEVLHLQRQLTLLKRCYDKKLDDELEEPEASLPYL
ncbi:Phytochelatin synthase, N-terminal catalytic domain [Dillenia turbinata]|uniref:glutathione gamma-glutamylcysteinyltransferase n=1 Tax=Dillenia turbinata TaxID=194707 RepID=A0AAN8VXT2_9MAGN